MRRFRTIKREIRILGIDDAPFTRASVKTAIIGLVFRGMSTIDGAMMTEICVDGDDATDKIAEMIWKSGHRRQLRVIMLYGITFGGFNIVRIQHLSEILDLPVIVVTDRRPRMDAVEKAIRHLDDREEKLEVLKEGGKICSVETRLGRPVYVQFAGIGYDEVCKILKSSTQYSRIPEPLRVANLIASALKFRS